MFITAESKHRSSACGVPARNIGFYSHKNLLVHSPDFLIFSYFLLIWARFPSGPDNFKNLKRVVKYQTFQTSFYGRTL